MKKIIILLLISNSTYSQSIDENYRLDNSAILGLENAFRHYALNQLSVVHNDIQYKHSSLQLLVDSLFEEIRSVPMPKWKRIYFEPYYKDDRHFRSIIDDLDLLHYSKDINKSILEIKGRIAKINSIEKRARAFFELSYFVFSNKAKFPNLQPGGLHFSLNAPTVSKLEDKNLAIISARLYGSLGFISNSLEIFTQALTVLDSLKEGSEMALLEEEIGQLYTVRNNNLYYQKSIDHYKRAVSFYSKAGRISDSLNARLKAALVMLWTGYPIRLLDVLSFRGKNSELIASKDLSTAFSLAGQSIENESRLYILKAAQDAINSRKGSNPLDYDFNISFLLGNYYAHIGDWNFAKTYLELAYIVACKTSFPNYNYPDVLRAMYRLSWVYAVLNEHSQAVKHADMAIQLVQKGEFFEKSNALFEKAITYGQMGKCEDGIQLVKEGLLIADSSMDFHREVLFERAFSILHKLYYALPNPDSSEHYYFRWTNLRSHCIQEFEALNGIEIDYANWVFESRIGHLAKKLSLLDEEISLKNILLDSKGKEELRLNNVIKLKADSLLLLHSQAFSMSEKVASLRKDSTTLAGSNLEQQKSLKNNRVWLTRLIIGLSIAMGGIIIFWLLLKARNEKLKRIWEKADKDARNFIHNLETDFSDFSDFIEDDNPALAKQYASTYSSYLDLVYKKRDWQHKTWRLKDELDMMYAYYNVKAVLGKRIEIIENVSSYLYEARCISDTLITILHNSIKHADPKKSPVFKVTVSESNSLLFFELEDNGIPSSLEEYFQEDEDHGLSYLRTRIRSIAKDSKISRRIAQPFDVIPIEGRGTIVKFVLPHEKI